MTDTAKARDLPDNVRELLERERRRLEELSATTRADAESSSGEREVLGELSTVDQHPGDVGSEVFEREQQLSIAGQFDQELVEVQAAMVRLDEDRYGLCETCGGAIGRARLEAIPQARYCIDHQPRTATRA